MINNILTSFSEMLEIGNGVVVLITGLLGLLGTGVGAFFAIKNFINSLKGKKLSEVWGLIQSMADAAMREAEKSALKGADKKAMVIDSVKAGCKSAGVNIDAFIDQLDDYIDQTVLFVNGMTKNIENHK